MAPPAAQDTASQDFAFCELRVREDDKDRFLAALFAPAVARGALHALYAFDLELRAIAQRVHEPMAGDIRLQWWREVAEGARSAEAQASPVAAALCRTIERYDLPRDLILDAIDIHALDLMQTPFASAADLEDYAARTSGAIIRLAARVLDNAADRAALERAAGDAARASTIIDVLRHFARNAARGQNWIPSELLSRHGVTGDAVLAGVSSPGLLDTLAELRHLARRHHAAAVGALRAISPAARPAFLTTALVPLYLREMERPGYDPFTSAIDAPQWRRQLRLWRTARAWRRPQLRA